MIDYAAAWTELAAWTAEEPNRGRAATLAKMAELAAKHTVAEDELDRALRLVAPRIQELIFNRAPQLVELLTRDSAVADSSPPGGLESVGPAMAVR